MKIESVEKMLYLNLKKIMGFDSTFHLYIADWIIKNCEEFLKIKYIDKSGEPIRGDIDMVVACTPNGKPIQIIKAKKAYATSHLRFAFVDEDVLKNPKTKTVDGHVRYDITDGLLLNIDINTAFLLHKDVPSANYFAYQIRFPNRSIETTKLDAKTITRLNHGYFGITSRNVATRFTEHLRLAQNNSGSMLHSVWHSMMDYREVVPTVSIHRMAFTLDEIYAIEEKAVREWSLAPMGLNAIPGGWEGIKMLHQLGMMHKRKTKYVTPEDRDDALTRLERLNHPHGSPCCHYRRGHLRKLNETRHTWVTGHFVNADKEVQDEAMDSSLVFV
jgi:hypothetical protein